MPGPLHPRIVEHLFDPVDSPHDLSAVGARLLGMDELTSEQAAILAFERMHWKFAGAKEARIRELFDLSSTVYYQRLNSIIDLPAALAHDPLLVRRLQRLRAARQRQRSVRKLS